MKGFVVRLCPSATSSRGSSASAGPGIAGRRRATCLPPLPLIVGLGPHALGAAEVGPEVHGRPERTCCTPVRNLTHRLCPDCGADRGRPRVALEALGVLEAVPVAAQFAQQARGQLGAGPGSEPKMSWSGCWANNASMALRYSCRCFSRRLQLPGQRHGQAALGPGDGGDAAELGPARAKTSRRRCSRVSGRESRCDVKELLPGVARRLLQETCGVGNRSTKAQALGQTQSRRPPRPPGNTRAGPPGVG